MSTQPKPRDTPKSVSGIDSTQIRPEAALHAPSEPRIYYISGDKPGTRWDGAPIRIITEVTPHEQEHPSSLYLDQPLFVTENVTIQPAGNRLVNTEDCNPDFLLTLIDRVENGDMPYPKELGSNVIETVRMVLLGSATPRDFYDRLSKFTDVIFKDDASPAAFRATGKLFFESMANRKILAFDVHDLLHHPLQLQAWPQQFQAIAGAGAIAHSLPKDFASAKRLQKLTQLTWLASFEESLITTDDQLVSFGCLNWLSPSETPFDTKPNINTLSIPEQKIAYRWHYLDALKDMFRIQNANSQQFGETLNWLEKLGYGMDEELASLVNSDDPRPFENLSYEDALRFTVKTPSSPEALFENALQLIEEEFSGAKS